MCHPPDLSLWMIANHVLTASTAYQERIQLIAQQAITVQAAPNTQLSILAPLGTI